MKIFRNAFKNTLSTKHIAFNLAEYIRRLTQFHQEIIMCPECKQSNFEFISEAKIISYETNYVITSATSTFYDIKNSDSEFGESEEYERSEYTCLGCGYVSKKLPIINLYTGKFLTVEYDL